MRRTMEGRETTRANLGRTAQEDEGEEETPDQAPRDKADSWLRAIAEEEDEVKNMILRDLMGQKDFLNA
jgi:hypothetical protein